MNTIHHTALATDTTAEAVVSHEEPNAVVDAPRREPVWRVVGGSVAAGFVGAIVLTIGVFGGAAEHVISGSALLAFAAGWAVLAMLSARFTSQPQRWARVPAVSMAVAGLTLLIVKPDDQALNAAGWVWPPIAFALAVWMIVQLRCSLGGHCLHLNCSGAGSPTVVLESGLGSTSANWARVTAEVSRTTRVCAYDSAGQGWSDDVNAHRTDWPSPRTCTTCSHAQANQGRTCSSATPRAVPTS